MYTEPKNLIISNGVLQNSSDVFAILDPDSGGAATFSVRLSADGLEPVTHWGARTPLLEATYNALVNMSVAEFKTYVDQVASGYNPPREPVGSVTAFKNNVQISEGSFWDAVAALGLKRIEASI